jgi:hypothetical protein
MERGDHEVLIGVWREGWSEMTRSDVVATALAPLRELLQADGYALQIVSCDDGELVLQIEAGPDACAECLVPKAMMGKYVAAALSAHPELAELEAELRYPAGHAAA